MSKQIQDDTSTCTRMRPTTSLHRTRMLIQKCRTLYSKCSFDLHSALHEQGGKLKKLLHLQISSGLRSGRNRDTSLTDAKAPWAFLALTMSLLSIIQAPSLDLFMEEWMDRNMQLKRVLGCTSMCLLTCFENSTGMSVDSDVIQRDHL